MAFGSVTGTLTGNGNSITASNSIAGSVVVNVGDLVFAVIAEQTSLTATTASDNLGNTYTAQNAGTLSGTSVSGRAYWSRVTVAGTLTSVSIVATSSTHDWAGFAAVLQGPFAISPLDASPANITSDISSPFTCPATGTLAQANEAVIAWGVANQSTVWAATSPNLLAGNVANSTNAKVAIGSQAVSATTTVTPNFTAAANPTADVLGTISFKQAPPFPNGWQRAADNIMAAAGVWPMVLLATQATTFAVPGPALDNNIVGIGWHQQLSSAAPVAQAQQGFAFVPFDTPQVAPAPNPQGWLQAQSSAPRVAQANPTQATTFAVPAVLAQTPGQIGWYQPLSSPAPVAKPKVGSSFVPFNTVQVATSAPSGWQTIQSSAPKTAVINGSALTFVVAPFTVPSGWQNQLSVAPPVAKAQLGSSFVPLNPAQIAPSTPSGWQQPLSGAAPVAKAQAGSTFVPLNAAQAAATPPPNGWFGPIAPAPKAATAQPTQATSFAVPPSPAQTPGQFGWYAPLSKAAPVAKAQAGHASVPLNTPQASTAIGLPLVYDAGSPRVANVYYQAWVNPLAPLAPVQATTQQMAWQQPLSVAAKLAQVAPQGFAFVPFNTAQVTPTPPSGWQQPLSVAVKSAAVSHTQPAWAPKPFPVLTIGWVQPLSKPVPVAQALQGNFFVPFNAVQLSNRITTYGWYSPLSKAAPVAQASVGSSFVPLDTVQVAPPPPPVVLAVPGGSSRRLDGRPWGASYRKQIKPVAKVEAPIALPPMAKVAVAPVPQVVVAPRVPIEVRYEPPTEDDEAALMAVIDQHLQDEAPVREMIAALLNEIIADLENDEDI